MAGLLEAPRLGDTSPLPILRQELRLHQAEPNADGSPAWHLHDPMRNRFFRIGWREFELLSRWHLGRLDKLLLSVNRETTLHLTPEGVQDLIQFLRQHELVVARQGAEIETLYRNSRQARQRKRIGLLRSWLFLRLPLIHPQRFLQATLPWVRHLAGQGFITLSIVIGILGLFLIAQQWSQFRDALPYLQTGPGLFLMLATLLLAKLVHELAHAYTAVHHGLKVPTIGVALILAWPVLYTETSEAWRLASRRARLQIGAAGMLAELVIAAWAGLAWALLPDGPLRATLFVVATTAWILTLAVNLNPLMRFDGYYLLSDLWRVQNLQARSFALARWWLRELLLGLGQAPPERPSRGMLRRLVGYAFATWIYRLTLFMGIALIVYHFLFKAAGLVLMATVLGWLVASPVLKELDQWWRIRGSLRFNRHTLLTLILLVAALTLLVVPLPSHVELPGVLRASHTQVVYPPEAARIATLFVRDGERIRRGQPLLRLAQPDLQEFSREAELDSAIQQQRLLRARNDPAWREDLFVATAHLARARSQVEAAEKRLARLQVTAPIDGTVRDLAAGLHPGRWLAADSRILRVVSAQSRIEAYAQDDDVLKLGIGDVGQFYLEGDPRQPLQVRLTRIDYEPLRELQRPYQASVHGGTIPVHKSNPGRPSPLRSTYRVYLVMAANAGPVTSDIHRGTVRLPSKPESVLGKVWRHAAAVFYRESGF